MNYNFITNKKELPEEVWGYVASIFGVGIIFIFFSSDPLWVSVLVALFLFWAGMEAACNTYTTFTFEEQKFTVGLPYRKYSLLWIRGNRTLTINDDAWDEVQVVRDYNKSESRISRRTFYFIKERELAFYFTAVGCADFENELRIRYSYRPITILPKEIPYRKIRPFIEKNPKRVI